MQRLVWVSGPNGFTQPELLGLEGNSLIWWGAHAFWCWVGKNWQSSAEQLEWLIYLLVGDPVEDAVDVGRLLHFLRDGVGGAESVQQHHLVENIGQESLLLLETQRRTQQVQMFEGFYWERRAGGAVILHQTKQINQNQPSKLSQSWTPTTYFKYAV